jgi:hypothetical protein
MVANDSPLWFPNRRVGERRRIPARRSGARCTWHSGYTLGSGTKERRAATFLGCQETLT